MSTPPSARTTVRRHRDRAAYDTATVRSVLTEATIAHVACQAESTTLLVPIAYGVRGDELVLHGAAGNAVLRAAVAGAELTAAVTLVDGMVLARSTFNHSVNYRSVVVRGTGREVTDPAEKAACLEAVVDHLLPGRSAEARPPSPSELRQTLVVALPIDEASAKVRTGPPGDGDGEDAALDVWAGVLPLRTVAGAPEPAPGLGASAPASPSWAEQARWSAV